MRRVSGEAVTAVVSRLSRNGTLVCALAAVSLPVMARLVTGPPGAVVHVRWAAGVDASAREELEAHFRLLDAEPLGGSTWRYDLVDPSPEVLRALVRDPAVDDTHHIIRERFVLADTERTARRGRIRYGDALVTAADGLAIALLCVALWRSASVRTLVVRSGERALQAETLLTPYVVLALLGVAVYAVALWFPPTDGDDLSYLSSITTIDSPLYYFVQDAGAGGNVYRPLLPVGMWVVYQGFGVWAMPNQIINLALHLANVFLLYRIVRREQDDRMIAVLFAAVFMVSQYTFAAAAWVSDRPMALTGLFALLFLNYVSQHVRRVGETSVAPVRVAVVAALSVLALMSKESGLVVPAVGLLFALMPGASLTPPHRVRLVAVTGSIILLYLGCRTLIFGSNAASYSQDGYMFLGWLHYDRTSELPPLLRYLSFAENVIKNALAPVLPVFDDGGALLSQYWLLAYSPVIASTALLCGLVLRRHLSPVQWIALTVILMNAVAHFALFRFRLHYLSHAAFCVFVASSPLLGQSRKKVAAATLALLVLGGSILSTSSALNRWLLERNGAFETLVIEGVKRYGDVTQEVLDEYR